nr:hypothetical protein [Croceicoccus hydrothermalis]
MFPPQIVARSFRSTSEFGAEIEQVGNGRPRPTVLDRDFIDFGEAAVGDHKPPVAIIHREAVLHIVQGQLEPKRLQGALGHGGFQFARHESIRPLAAPTLEVQLAIGLIDHLEEPAHVEPVTFGGLAKLASQQTAFNRRRYVRWRQAASPRSVSVIVWLCRHG